MKHSNLGLLYTSFNGHMWALCFITFDHIITQDFKGRGEVGVGWGAGRGAGVQCIACGTSAWQVLV